MQEISFELRGEFIELCNLLKLTGIAQSGGQGKAMVADGLAQVDGLVELRKTAKIRKNQIVECFDTKILIT
jgi:ribosome-associated protein